MHFASQRLEFFPGYDIAELEIDYSGQQLVEITFCIAEARPKSSWQYNFII